jgi:hypothetical protein
LLRGEIRTQDLSDLFLYVREHSDNRETIRDVGDLIAHPQKTKGIFADKTQRFFTVVDFLNIPIGYQLNFRRLPKNFSDVLDASFYYIDDATIKKHTNIRRVHAQKMLPDIKNALVPNADQLTLSAHHFTSRPAPISRCSRR